ncbi:MAG: hypothetical protein HND48_22010 [Chloroflexi bacterium]|nr:hypothetical protein [Chloroflexota bacterium]
MAWPLPNGTTAYYELRCVALTDRQVMLLVRNITTLRRAEAALRARLDDLSALRVLEAQLSDSIDYVACWMWASRSHASRAVRPPDSSPCSRAVTPA